MTAAAKLTLCGAVRPFWVDAGWVRWVGTAVRERAYSIVYRRCSLAPLPAVELRGFTYALCQEHLGEVAARGSEK